MDFTANATEIPTGQMEIQIQIHKYKYTNTNTQMQVHKYKNMKTWEFYLVASGDDDEQRGCDGQEAPRRPWGITFIFITNPS